LNPHPGDSRPSVLQPVEAGQARPHRVLDRTIGIVLGVILGLAVVAGFVFWGSEGTIDAPRISGVKTGKQAPGQQRAQPHRSGQAGQ
jgi:hypothetical protein